MADWFFNWVERRSKYTRMDNEGEDYPNPVRSPIKEQSPGTVDL